jgi:hypothetical protein
MAGSKQQQQQLLAAASSSQSNSDRSSLSAASATGHAPEQHTSLAAASSDSSISPAQQQQQQPNDSKGRWIRIVVASIKAVLFLELAGMVARPLIASKLRDRRHSSGDSDSGSGSDLDPADVLMDYLTGRTSA